MCIAQHDFFKLLFKQILMYLYKFIIEIIIVITLQNLNIHFIMYSNIYI